jgi:UDP-glucose 4-epimerase
MVTRRILVTGGAGCLGSSLVARYLEQGHQVLVIDNFATGRRDALSPASGFSLVEGSIDDARLVRKAFARFQPTHVIHSAAAYKDPHDWKADVGTNVLGAINVAQASVEHGVRRMVNFQTALCYGRPREVPIPVDHPVAPFTSYGISKSAGEQFLMQAGLPVVSLRLANVCGPGLAIGPIPTFYNRLKAGQACYCSETIRDFLDMSDFLALMDRVIEDDAPTGLFNVSTGEGHSIIDVYRAVARYLKMESRDVTVVPPGADDVPAVVLDPSATERAFGWEASVGFEETIRRQLEWYDRHGVINVPSHLALPKEAGAASRAINGKE